MCDDINDRWHRGPGDRLLSPGRDAWLAGSGDERNYRLLRGDKRASDILVEQALNDVSDRDSLVFPVLFNYRHFIEINRSEGDHRDPWLSGRRFAGENEP